VTTLWLPFVVGHQKKMMLAVDRLKKLQLAAKRNAQQNAELFDTSQLPPPEQCLSMCESYPSPSVIYHSQSRPCIGGLQNSPSYFAVANGGDSYQRPSESMYAARSRSLVPHQPEMVAIQVRRSGNIQSPAVYDVPVISPTGYESFHGGGVPVRDISGVGRVYDDMSVIRMRRASDNSHPSSPCHASLYSMMTPPSCVSSGYVRMPLSRGSAPSTPLHIASRLAPSTATPKRIPPVPPQRTNSVKVCDSPLLPDVDSRLNNSTPPQYKQPNCGSLDRMSVMNRRHSAEAAQNMITTVPCSGNSEVVTLAAVETGSTGDCSTLPFANEHIGTIRQRSSTSHDDDDDDERPMYDEYSGTVRRRGVYSCLLSCNSVIS